VTKIATKVSAVRSLRHRFCTVNADRSYPNLRRCAACFSSPDKYKRRQMSSRNNICITCFLSTVCMLLRQTVAGHRARRPATRTDSRFVPTCRSSRPETEIAAFTWTACGCCCGHVTPATTSCSFRLSAPTSPPVRSTRNNKRSRASK